MDKKWCTARDDKHGKRILIQITLDVMNVRKPFVSATTQTERITKTSHPHAPKTGMAALKRATHPTSNPAWSLLHIVRQRANPIRSSGSGEVQQRHGRPCCGTGQEGTPGATLVPLVSSAETSRNALCHGPADSGMTVSRSTTGHPPQHQAQPAWHVLLWWSVPGMCAPSVGELLPEPLRLCVPHCAVLPSPFAWSAQTTVVSTANWTLPKMESPSTTTSRRRVSCTSGRAKSMSRTMTLVVTLPPASRQIRASTFSTANPLLPRTPAQAQAAVVATGIEWRPHQQLRPVKRRGRRRRRRRRIRNKCGSKRVTRHNGHVARANPEPSSEGLCCTGGGLQTWCVEMPFQLTNELIIPKQSAPNSGNEFRSRTHLT